MVGRRPSGGVNDLAAHHGEAHLGPGDRARVLAQQVSVQHDQIGQRSP